MFDGIGNFAVPLLAIDRVAREFQDVALELTLAHRTEEFLMEGKEFTCLMLASSLAMVPEVLTLDSPIDFADETGRKGSPYSPNDPVVAPSGPETLRLLKSGGRVLGLAQQRQILAAFRRELPGHCTLTLEGPWNPNLAAATKADINIGIIKMKPLKNFLETIKHNIQLAGNYAAEADYQNAFRLLDSAESRLIETEGKDISNEKMKKAARDLGVLCFANLGNVLRGLALCDEEPPVERTEAAKLLMEMELTARTWLGQASLLPSETGWVERGGLTPHLLHAHNLAKDIKLETIML